VIAEVDEGSWTELSGIWVVLGVGEGTAATLWPKAIDSSGWFQSIQATSNDAAPRTGSEATALKMLATENLGSMVESYRFYQRKRKLRAEHRLKTRLEFRF
jgi:hypothetical protein